MGKCPRHLSSPPRATGSDMKTRTLIACALAFQSVASMAGAQIRSPPLGPSVVRSIKENPQVTIFDDVDARVDGDSVVLTGKVSAAAKRSGIEKRVSRVDGVRGLKNEITVLPTAPEGEELRRRVA